jgi:hypothetical protein
MTLSWNNAPSMEENFDGFSAGDLKYFPLWIPLKGIDTKVRIPKPFMLSQDKDRSQAFLLSSIEIQGKVQGRLKTSGRTISERTEVREEMISNSFPNSRMRRLSRTFV